MSSALLEQGRARTRWRRRLYGGLGAAAAVGLLAVLGVLIPLDWVTTLSAVFMYILLAEGWNILGGYAGYLNFGMVTFFGVGAYTAGVLCTQYNVHPLLTIPLAGIMATVVALLVGVPALRLRGVYFAILTLIISFLTQVLVTNLDITGGASGIYMPSLPFDPFTNEQIFYYAFLGLMLLAVLLAFIIEHSRFGYALVAIREDEDPAEILGVRTTWLKTQALLLGAFLAGVAGAIYAFHTSYIEPQGTFSLDISIDVVLMSLVGGLGTWQGPVIGVPLMLVTAQVLRILAGELPFFGSTIPPEFDRVVFGIILILVALLAPYGVMGLVRRVRGRRLTV
ncbi:MAG: branched-chain amino acid ABC transporter permease [Thermogemmatispora sp.]|jgi:branched-chain amino acid transport system permease protein|uniref:branched-chain amino acid ABC transporter permease n=1 Tax=Thermogemmatispora sp. TaxID=1968838 RepID=UPI0019F60F4E|nr:branched-chain amino acid ABC transporter permease [Thermogemmatispora sp.]MBE3566132.1 branched-chain amino acid ABC transporter permease [Thermogemmatispora sp.]